MKKSLIYSLVLLSALFMSTAISTTAQGVTYNVGVKPGDWAEYSETLSLSSLSVRVRIDIVAVSGTTVTLNETLYNTNGSVAFRFQFSGDIASPLGMLYLGMNLIPANLAAGDALSSGSPYVINETVPMTIANSQRSCNHVAIHSNIQSNSVSIDYYWDQVTGILVKEAVSYSGASGSYSTTITMTSTDLFTAGLGAMGTLVLGVVGVAVGVLMVVILVVTVRSRRENT